MCDFSLHAYQTREARVGESLRVQVFESGSIGFVSPGDDLTAVCVKPGCQLELSGISKALQRELGVGSEEEVTFVQFGAASNSYRDGIRFRNGKEVLLQRLEEGIIALVLPEHIADQTKAADVIAKQVPVGMLALPEQTAPMTPSS